MNEQAWLGNRKVSKESEEPSPDGVCPGSGFMDMIADKCNSRRDQPPPSIDASWQKGV
jgi:hypothetical protein